MSDWLSEVVSSFLFGNNPIIIKMLDNVIQRDLSEWISQNFRILLLSDDNSYELFFWML